MLRRTNVIPLVIMAMVPWIIIGSVGQRAIEKRSVAANPAANLDYPDYPAKYDEYPVVVPKRAALLFDQLMIALQKVVDNQGRGDVATGRTLTRSMSPITPHNIRISSDEQTMDLKRRGQGKGRVYWRCYFNAVTCFKRK